MHTASFQSSLESTIASSAAERQQKWKSAVDSLKGSAKLVSALAEAIPWGMIRNAAEMAESESAWQWSNDYLHYGGRGWKLADSHAQVESDGRTIWAVSSGGHSVKITVDEDWTVTQVHAGVDESQYSFGHSLPPVERAKHIVQKLKDNGIKVANGATYEVERDWKVKQEAIRFLTKQGPERPSTRVKQALKKFNRRDVVQEAKRLWPLTFASF